MTATITDGLTTITFSSFNAIGTKIINEGVKIFPALRGRGQRVGDPGKRRLQYDFAFSLTTTEGGESAYTKYLTLKALWKTEVLTYEFQRKLQFTKPGTTDIKTLQGKITNIVFSDFSSRTAHTEITGKLFFVPDTKSDAVTTGTSITNTYDVEKLQDIIVIDGKFEDFDSSVTTDAQFSENAAGDSFSQTGGEILLEVAATAQNGVLYLDENVLSPFFGLPWPTYVYLRLETKVKIGGNANMAGFAVSHADEDYGTANKKFWVGLYKTDTKNGIRIIKPDGSTVDDDSVTIAIDTYYFLEVKIKYNMANINLGKTIYINVKVNGTEYVTDSAVARGDLYGVRLDGLIGLAADIPTAAAGGDDITFGYWCNGRIEELLNGYYEHATLFIHPEIKFQTFSFDSEGLFSNNINSLIRYYDRNDGSNTYLRYQGFIHKADQLDTATLEITGYHYSQVLDTKLFIGSFSDKTTSFIITDGSTGLFATNTSGIDISDVATGTVALTKQYYQQSKRSIILQLSAEENFIPWLTNDGLKLRFEPAGLDTEEIEIVEGDSNLLFYKFEAITDTPYTKVVIEGIKANGKYEIENPIAKGFKGGERVGSIVDPEISSQAGAERRAYAFFKETMPLQFGTMTITKNPAIKIGNVLKLTLNDTNIAMNDKAFVITKIREDFLSNNQTITLAEDTVNVATNLLKNSKQTDFSKQFYIDQSATANLTQIININLMVWGVYLIETSTNGSDWTTSATASVTVTNRAIAILTGCLGNRNTSNPVEGDFSNGLVFAIGTGTANAKITDQALGNSVATKAVTTITQSSVDIPSISAIATWDDTEANGNAITEASYYVDRTDSGVNTTYEYGTAAVFAPYNTDTDILVRCVFSPISKTNAIHLRVTLTMYLETDSSNRNSRL